MACPERRPCSPWATSLDPCCQSGGPCSGQIPNGYDPSEVLQWATEIVWALSGRRYGLCQATVRPCRRSCKDSLVGLRGGGWEEWMWPYPSYPLRSLSGNWVNCGCGCSDCCHPVCDFILPRGPICSIDEVKVDGVVLGKSLYRVDNWRSLVRTGGGMFAQPITGLVNGAVKITGPDPIPTGDGVVFPTDGNTYTVDLGEPFPIGTGRLDSMYEFDIAPGCPGLSFNVFGLSGGVFEVDAVSGGVTVTKGPGQLVTVSAPTLSNQVGKIRVRSTAEGSFDTEALFHLVNGCGINALKLTKVSWADPNLALQTCWPECQSMEKADTEPGTWSIKWTYGVAPPLAGVKAVQALACELAKSCFGGPCKLPERVTSITQRGVTMALLDPLDFLEKGRTGITQVDLFLMAVNPNKLLTRARIFRADARPRGRRVDT